MQIKDARGLTVWKMSVNCLTIFMSEAAKMAQEPCTGDGSEDSTCPSCAARRDELMAGMLLLHVFSVPPSERGNFSLQDAVRETSDGGKIDMEEMVMHALAFARENAKKILAEIDATPWLTRPNRTVSVCSRLGGLNPSRLVV